MGGIESYNEDNLSWQDSAACRGNDPDLFFPVGKTGLSIQQIAAAKEVCLSCVARVSCLEFAIMTKQEYGVWGGTSEEERKTIQRVRRAS